MRIWAVSYTHLYQGLDSFKFEVNCADWLGKLLYEGKIKQANIVYGPYTNEHSDQFKEINEAYNINSVSYTHLDVYKRQL